MRELVLFAAVADDLHGQAEGERKGYGLPHRLLLSKRQDHHHKTEQAYHNRKGVLFRKILSHHEWIYTGCSQTKIGLKAVQRQYSSAEASFLSVELCFRSTPPAG